MSNLFSFGEKIPEYDMKVLNEREVRASAGILFLFAMISFLNSWLIGDFTITKIFVTVFLVDFTIRVLINPKYSPTLIISRFFVRNQEVEYVGAPQKRFAWMIGLVLAVIMFYLVVLNNLIGPFNLLICLICLTLLFFEAAFGICLGCKIYNLFHKQKAQLCPGNACEIKDRVAIQNINPFQYVLVPVFLGLIAFVANSSLIQSKKINGVVVTKAEDCVAPDWAIKMGHKEKWKLHNGCGGAKADTSEAAPAQQAAVEHEAPVAISPEKKPATEPTQVANKDCEAPGWAIKMGHEEKWKLHNGCGGTKADTAEAAPVQQAAVEHQAPVAITPEKKHAEPTQVAAKDCVTPDWAIKMGHEEMWKQHNGCADPAPQKIEPPKVVAPVAPVEKAAEPAGNKDCIVPDWAKKMGHEDKWKLHNGCQ